MKSFIYIALCGIIAFFFNRQTAYAAFPVHVETENNVSVKTERQALERFINSNIERYHLAIQPVSDEKANDGGVRSIISFGLGLMGLAALVVAFLAPMITELLVVVAIGLGIGAIITGIKGKRHEPFRGLGLAGFILGIIDLSIIVLGAVALAAFIVAYLLA